MNDIIKALQFEKEQLEAKNRLLQEKIESDNRQISAYDAELREAKRLLKAALADMNNGGCNSNCYKCKHCGVCDYSERFTWKLTDEAEKLIGGSENAT